MATQFDILHHQAEAAARNAAAKAESELRRDASLVNQSSRWAGRAMTEGEASLRSRANGRRRSTPLSRQTEAAPTRPAPPAPDGYVRRSPVQPLHVAEGYRRRQALRAVAVAVVIVAACVGIYLLNQLGIFGR